MLDFVNEDAELRKVNRLCDRKQAFVDAVVTFRDQHFLSFIEKRPQQMLQEGCEKFSQHNKIGSKTAADLGCVYKLRITFRAWRSTGIAFRQPGTNVD